MTSVAIYSHEDRFGAHRNKVTPSFLLLSAVFDASYDIRLMKPTSLGKD